jgi:F-type H+-transporting ATPase subunit b
LDKLGLNLGYLIVQILNFGIVFLTIYEWIYKPLMGMLNKRRATLAQSLEDARIAAEARANAEIEASTVLSDAQVKAAEIIREATDRAEKVGREVRAEADAQASHAREVALAEVETERQRILSDLRGQVATLAIAAAQKIIHETLDEKRQRNLVDEFFSGVRAGKVVVLEDTQLKGQTAEVTSALPLTAMEQETVKKEILSLIGADAIVSFRVDTGILGGLVVRVGDRVIDGSVSGQLEVMRQNLA